jgi:integrase/recombinase XerD
MDIHNYKGRFERTIERVNESSDISKDNKEIILKFKDYCISEGIGLAKLERYIGDLMKYARMLNKYYPDASKEDIRRVIAGLEQSPLSPETRKGFKIMLRKLYRFIEGIEERGIYPEKVRWISINIPNNHKKLPEELLTDEEIKKIVQKCDNARDKALIAVLSESGCRVGEIGTLKIKHISFEETGARITVAGKTGMRKILVINSAPYLQQWINQHPTNALSDSWLWIGSNGELLCYARIASILKSASKRAGIGKKVYPHLLRHSRATILATIMSDASMKHYLGWTQGSKMAGIYIHMSGKDTDEAILRASGIEVKKKEVKTLLKPKKCLRCSTTNEATNICCKICGMILDEQKQQEVLMQDTKRAETDRLMNELVKDKEFLEFMIRKIKEKAVQ